MGTIVGTGAGESLGGTSLNDLLDGRGGVDTMKGGSGNDVYVVDQIGDRVVETSSSGGIDWVISSISFTLGTYQENLKLAGTAAVGGTGNGLANRLVGNSADNRLDGGAGADVMVGWSGNDTYVIDNAGDKVRETSATGGMDTVLSSVSYSLGAFVENLTLTGSAAIGATGNGLANRLTGNSAANVLNGGGGADTMAGGGGADSYFVDNGGDRVIEAAGAGVDKVTSSVSHTLAANVEKLVLTGTAAAGTGNGLANSITGNAAANLLDGRAGADTMSGGGGNDVYVVDHAGDKAVETSAGGGTDTVQSSVDFVLGAYVERLTLTGTAAIEGTGNGLANRIVGNVGGNILSGGSGNDLLIGRRGSDVLTGGTGVDRFVLDAPPAADNIDRITDFWGRDDTIMIDRAVLGGFAADGVLQAGQFRLGTTARDADDRILYDKATGRIFLDRDGSGAAAAVLLAQVKAGTTLAAADFEVYGLKVAAGIADRTVNDREAWSIAVPSTAFRDADGDSLSYSASLANGAGLPSWLKFDPATATFSGKPPAAWNGALALKVTATDGRSKVSDSFIVREVPELSGDYSGKTWGRASVGFEWDDWYFTYEKSVRVEESFGPFTGWAEAGVEVAAGIKAGFQLASSNIAGSLKFDIDERLATADEVAGAKPWFTVSTRLTGASDAEVKGADPSENFIELFVGAFADFHAGAGFDVSFAGVSFGADLGISNEDLYPGLNLLNTSVEIRVDADDSFTLEGEHGAFTVGLPKPVLPTGFKISSDGRSLVATATSDPFISASVDLDSLLVKAFPKLALLFGRDISVYNDGVSVSAGFFVEPVSLNLVGNLRLHDKVKVEGGARIVAKSSFGETVTGLSGDKIEFTKVPEGEGTFKVDATYYSQAVVTSTLAIRLDAEFVIELFNLGVYWNSGVDSGREKMFTLFEKGFGLGGPMDIPFHTLTYRIDLPDKETQSFVLPYERYRTVALSGDSWSLTSHQPSATGNERVNDLTGNAYANVIDGRGGGDALLGMGGDDRLDGGDGGDLLDGGDGNDTLLGGAGSDQLDGGAGNDIVSGGSGDEQIEGGVGNDDIRGDAGNDILIGGAGLDTLDGGAGNDVMYVDNIGDKVADSQSGAAGGNDIVYASVDIELEWFDYIETIILTGNGAIQAVGNNSDNIIVGNSRNNRLYGRDGDDRLDGGPGADRLVGGHGSDTYVVDNPGDVLDIVAFESGEDDVISSISYTLLVKDIDGSLHAYSLRNLTLSGSAAIDGTGNGEDNLLVGNDAANRLDGAGGADTMKGGGGNDIYIVQGRLVWNGGSFTAVPDDIVIEAPGAGVDLVKSSASFVLGPNIENLILTAPAPQQDGAIDGTGNGLANVITGNAFANRIEGGGGADVMKGGAGDDFYTVDTAGDKVVERAGEGIDTVSSSVTYRLTDNVEILALKGSAAVNGTGNALNNLIEGNGAANILKGLGGDDTLAGLLGADSLDGGAGNDFLFGGAGKDLLTGGAGRDGFVFDAPLSSSTNADRILDFKPSEDSIWLDLDIFKALQSPGYYQLWDASGVLAPAAFHAGTAGQDNYHRIIYDTATGRIFWDVDGSGTSFGNQAPVLFATVGPGTEVNYQDFLVFVG